MRWGGEPRGGWCPQARGCEDSQAFVSVLFFYLLNKSLKKEYYSFTRGHRVFNLLDTIPRTGSRDGDGDGDLPAILET